jgi:hypothetical protein
MRDIACFIKLEEVKMMKKISTIFVTLLIAGLIAPCIALATATTPSTISGGWAGWVDADHPMTISNTKIAGANTFHDVSNFGKYKPGGDIQGTFYQEFKVANHFKDPKLIDQYIADGTLGKYWDVDSFEWTQMVRTFTGTVKVDGVTYSGGFTMFLRATGTGNNQNPTPGNAWTLEGTWTIVEGTGGLEGLHGHGTWWHYATGMTGLDFEGQVYFD